jgi:hypothetical protein
MYVREEPARLAHYLKAARLYAAGTELLPGKREVHWNNTRVCRS